VNRQKVIEVIFRKVSFPRLVLFLISSEHVKPTNKIKAEKFKSAEKRFNWISGDILEDRKSTFQAHVVRVFSKEEVRYENIHYNYHILGDVCSSRTKTEQ
jgi:hypothetical protein